MRRLEHSLPTAAENVALDEALLEWAETENPTWEFLRIWESPRPAVVIGRSSRVAEEVTVETCRERQVDIVRRSSGGAAIVAGPGCLMYGVVLSYRLRPELRDIARGHREVLGRFVNAVSNDVAITQAGTSDLVVSAERRVEAGESRVAKKFSGNSMRARRTHMLYHGTLLYDFDLSLISELLRTPPRQPKYRDGRDHNAFVVNLDVDRQTLIRALDAAWPTEGPLTDWPQELVRKLVAERFSRDEWTFERS